VFLAILFSAVLACIGLFLCDDRDRVLYNVTRNMNTPICNLNYALACIFPNQLLMPNCDTVDFILERGHIGIFLLPLRSILLTVFDVKGYITNAKQVYGQSSEKLMPELPKDAVSCSLKLRKLLTRKLGCQSLVCERSCRHSFISCSND
jgi:hypothetical protein